ncbi:MAG: polysaccharide lyase family protein [Opitutaceae bacterium]
MDRFPQRFPEVLRRAALVAWGVFAGTTLPAQAVNVSETPDDFVLSNGVLTARVLKRNGDLGSLSLRGVELLNHKSGHAGGYWSHDVTGAREIVTRVTLDPAGNGGERGEVSVLGVSGGGKMGHGPGAARDGDFPADIEIRYALGRGDSGLYAYCVFTHRPEYPAGTMAEARFAAKLADAFDWMTLSERRSQAFPADLREGDKYIYTAVQFDHPVFGWSSTRERRGFWLINPSLEYLSGGPTKVEFLCHRDTTPVAAPIVLNYWRSSHYGGAAVEVGAGEHWTKVIGPFLLYVNEGGDAAKLWADARARHQREAAQWPYAWVKGVDYPHGAERATVAGRLRLRDPEAPGGALRNLLVGLVPAAYPSPVARPGAAPRRIDWQTDAKHYQFWVRGDTQGRFAIPHVRPGRYALRAFADGVLGEFGRGDIEVGAGRALDLGELPWTPVRRGRELWAIGLPNRNGTEFAGGEEYADPAISLKYAERFPRDVNYVVGRSDFRRDWFFQHVPHNEDPQARPAPFFGVRGAGRATPFAVTFDLPAAGRGRATLRLALCGTGTRELEVTLNERPVGRIALGPPDGTITRHGLQGLWYERELGFDATLLRAGSNVLRLVVPAGPINNGVMYDYLRLEMDETAPPGN